VADRAAAAADVRAAANGTAATATVASSSSAASSSSSAEAAEAAAARALGLLGAHLESCGGAASMVEGWNATPRDHGAGRPRQDQRFFSPCGRTFRSKVEVARFFGLETEPAKQSRTVASSGLVEAVPPLDGDKVAANGTAATDGRAAAKGTVATGDTAAVVERTAAPGGKAVLRAPAANAGTRVRLICACCHTKCEVLIPVMSQNPKVRYQVRCPKCKTLNVPSAAAAVPTAAAKGGQAAANGGLAARSMVPFDKPMAEEANGEGEEGEESEEARTARWRRDEAELKEAGERGEDEDGEDGEDDEEGEDAGGFDSGARAMAQERLARPRRRAAANQDSALAAATGASDLELTRGAGRNQHRPHLSSGSGPWPLGPQPACSQLALSLSRLAQSAPLF
jgi:phage FluMu protein Com